MSHGRAPRRRSLKPATLRGRIGAAIQRQRVRLGWTQAELAEKADLSTQYIGEIERGEANTTVENLEIFGRLFGWDASRVISPAGRGVVEGVRRVLRTELRHINESITLIVDELEPLAAPREDR